MDDENIDENTSKKEENEENEEKEENIEKDFNSSEIKLKEHSGLSIEMLDFLRLAFFCSVFYIGFYLFYNYFPIEITHIETFWKNYNEKCCLNFTDNVTRCRYASECQAMLHKWFRIKQLNETLVIDRCCYWYASLTEYRLGVRSFCDLRCIS